jgi:hypothetical protein
MFHCLYPNEAGARLTSREPAASTTVPLLSLRRQQNGLWQDLDFTYATTHRGKTEGRYGWNREAVRERIEWFIVNLWYSDAKEIVSEYQVQALEIPLPRPLTPRSAYPAVRDCHAHFAGPETSGSELS